MWFKKSLVNNEKNAGVRPRPEKLAVLYIEDGFVDAMFVQRLLERQKEHVFQLQIAPTLKEGEEALRSKKYQLVLLDLNLPDSSLEKTIDWLGMNSEKFPIVILTASNDSALVAEVFRRGAQDYLIKGRFDGELLVRSMFYAIERFAVDQEVYCCLDRFGKDFLKDMEHVTQIKKRMAAHKVNRELVKREIWKIRLHHDVLLDVIPALVFYKDKNNILVKVNQTFAQAMGVPREELEGKNCKDFWPAYADQYWADDQKVLKSGQAKRRILEKINFSGKETRYLLTDKIPYLDEKGKVAGVIGFSVDVTEQKIAEDQLKRQERILSNVLAHVPQYVFWKDREGVFLGCNENVAKNAGFSSPEELIGKTDYDCPWTKEEADFYRKCDQAVMEKGESMLNIEETQVKSDGKKIHLLTHKVPLRDEFGEVIGILGMYSDITEKKNLEEELRNTIADLMQFKSVAVERENMMIDLKKQINELSKELGRPQPYNLDYLKG